jgi:large subunit ribosomal protein L19
MAKKNSKESQDKKKTAASKANQTKSKKKTTSKKKSTSSKKKSVSTKTKKKSSKKVASKPTSKKEKSKKKSTEKKKSDLPGKLGMAKKVRPGYLVKVVHLSPDGKRDFTTQGVVMRVRGEGQNKTFTVRTVVDGVGLEKVFSFASPALKELEILKKKLARRARLYFLRSENVSSAKKNKYLKGL